MKSRLLKFRIPFVSFWTKHECQILMIFADETTLGHNTSNNWLVRVKRFVKYRRNISKGCGCIGRRAERLWMSKTGVKHFTNPGNHVNLSCSTLAKSNYESTDSKSIRIYVRSFWNYYIVRQNIIKNAPTAPLNP